MVIYFMHVVGGEGGWGRGRWERMEGVREGGSAGGRRETERGGGRGGGGETEGGGRKRE